MAELWEIPNSRGYRGSASLGIGAQRKKLLPFLERAEGMKLNLSARRPVKVAVLQWSASGDGPATGLPCLRLRGQVRGISTGCMKDLN
jgi:hypothetical protein